MLVEEIFVPIVGYEGLFVNLSRNSLPIFTKIHRLVATHFLENPNGLRDNINHGTRNLRANDTNSLKKMY